MLEPYMNIKTVSESTRQSFHVSFKQKKKKSEGLNFLDGLYGHFGL